MKKRVLILTSPWSKFSNFIDNDFFLFNNVLQRLDTPYDILVSAHEFEKILGRDDYEDFLYENKFSKSQATLFRSIIRRNHPVTDIWYLQSDYETNSLQLDSILHLLASTYRNKRIVAFINNKFINLNSVWEKKSKITLILKSEISYLSLSQCFSFENSDLQFKTSFADNINNCSSPCYEHENYEHVVEKVRQALGDVSFIFPINFTELDSDSIIQSILSFSERFKCVDFYFKLIILNDLACRDKLIILFEKLANYSYSFRFYLIIPADTEIQYLSILDFPNIYSVSLWSIPRTDATSNEKVLRLNLHQLNLIKLLQKQRLKVNWVLLISKNISNELWDKFVKDLEALVGFVAPYSYCVVDEICDEKSIFNLNMSSEIAKLKDTLKKWKAYSLEHRLSAGNGPFFLKLFDKRGDFKSWRFITFNASQAAVYRLLDNLIDIKTIRENSPNINSDRLDNFLKFLEINSLIITLSQTYFLNVAQKRTFEEIWTTAEL